MEVRGTNERSVQVVLAGRSAQIIFVTPVVRSGRRSVLDTTRRTARARKPMAWKDGRLSYSATRTCLLAYLGRDGERVPGRLVGLRLEPYEYFQFSNRSDPACKLL